MKDTLEASTALARVQEYAARARKVPEKEPVSTPAPLPAPTAAKKFLTNIDASLQYTKRGDSALAVIQQEIDKAHKIKNLFENANLPKPILPPVEKHDSIHLMCDLMEEVFMVKTGLSITVFYKEHKDKSISITFGLLQDNVDYNERYEVTPERAYHIIAHNLSILAGMDFAQTIPIKPEKGKIKFQDKYEQFMFISEIVEQTRGLATPADIHMNPLSPEIYPQATQAFSVHALLRCKDQDTADALFRAVPAKPYVSMDHYLSHLFMTSQATLSIPLDHIYRCINQEEGYAMDPRANAFIFGGLH